MMAEEHLVRARHAVDDVQAAAVANALADADDAIGDVPKASSAPPAGPAALPGTAVVRANQPSDGTPSHQPMDTDDNTHGAVDATGPCTPDRGEDGDGLGSDDDDDGRDGRRTRRRWTSSTCWADEFDSSFPRRISTLKTFMKSAPIRPQGTR